MSDAALDPSTAPSAPLPAKGSRRVQPFLWSLRRELWETRSIFFAPVIAAAVVVLGYLVTTIGMPERRLHTLTLDAGRQSLVMGEPFAAADATITGVMILVAWFYCLGAMYDERRDRSVLFWRSLPVSDRTAVLAKLAVPMVAAPLVTFVAVAATQGVILLLSTGILTSAGVSAATPWTPLSIAAEGLVMAYGQVALSLWLAPVYAWFILVSAWARRAPFLWAVLPPAGLALFEVLAFHTSHIGHLILDRLAGAEDHAMAQHGGLFIRAGGPLPPSGLDRMDVGGFLATPGLWIGLAVAAALIAAAIWLRRRREPI